MKQKDKDLSATR